MKLKLILILAAFLLIGLPDVSQAHKVIVFAWVEDGMIHTESSFGSKRKAQKCQISLCDEKGTVLQKGVTDDMGEHTFKIPEKITTDLVVDLDAGPGHKAAWRLPYADLASPEEPENLAAAMKEKERLEQGPSIVKVLAGLGIIFLLALAVKLVHSKRVKGKGRSND